MTLLSAYEDFGERTLGVLGSAWSRLAYLSSLRQDGRYRHWGLERTFGESAAHAAIAQAHGEVALAILRRPMRDLRSELREEDYEDVRQVFTSPAAFSWETSGPVAAHLSLVAGALWELQRHRASATDPAA